MRISDWSSDVCSSDLGIGGVIGGNSSTERALAIALDAAAQEGFRTRMFGGEDMARLPLYNPRATMRTDDERAFVDAVRDASALIIASPRSEERRVGKACVSTCRTRWCPNH